MVATVTPQFQLQLTTHTYERAGRLVRANRLTERRLVDGSRVTYTYDDANQLTRILDAGVPTTLTYDESGNTLTARNTTQPHNVTLTWDAENRLHTYHQTWGVGPSSERITHTYNGDGQRVEREDGNGIVRFVYDGNNVILKQNTGFATLDQFLYEPALYGKLIASLSRWYHFDPLGASQTLTDGNGDDIEIYFYRPFGEIEPLFTIPEAGMHPFLFVGREGYYSDDEGINKNSSSPQKPLLVGDRFYMAAWGRWLSRDRAGFAGSWTNPYWYVGNNPVKFTDPSGLVRFTIFDIDPQRGVDYVIADLDLTLAVGAQNDPRYKCKTDCEGSCTGNMPVRLFWTWTPTDPDHPDNNPSRTGRYQITGGAQPATFRFDPRTGVTTARVDLGTVPCNGGEIVQRLTVEGSRTGDPMVRPYYEVRVQVTVAKCGSVQERRVAIELADWLRNRGLRDPEEGGVHIPGRRR